MTEKDIYAILQSTGIPFRYFKWNENESVPIPFRFMRYYPKFWSCGALIHKRWLKLKKKQTD